MLPNETVEASRRTGRHASIAKAAHHRGRPYLRRPNLEATQSGGDTVWLEATWLEATWLEATQWTASSNQRLVAVGNYFARLSVCAGIALAGRAVKPRALVDVERLDLWTCRIQLRGTIEHTHWQVDQVGHAVDRMLKRMVTERERERENLNGCSTPQTCPDILRCLQAISGTTINHQSRRRDAEHDVLASTIHGAAGSESHGREGEDGNQSFASVHAGYLKGTTELADTKLSNNDRKRIRRVCVSSRCKRKPRPRTSPTTQKPAPEGP